MVKRLSHISLRTRQLETLITFYCEHLDCKIVHEFCNEQRQRYGAFLLIGDSGTFLELFNDDSALPLSPTGSLRHFCFEVTDIAKTAETFVALGFPATVQRGKTDHILQFFITDPDGNEIEFHQYDEGCKLWPYVGDHAVRKTS